MTKSSSQALQKSR